ncbi:MAG: hypothetical protein HKN37_10475 [Rhodothermales bacterium]|nr:hypothetical protein [Rhodothermales bacterium]
MTARSAIRGLVILFLCATPVSCEMFEDTKIDPFEGQGAYFTMYGFLDATRVEQEIRISPVRRTPEVIRSPTDDNAFIDAAVTSTDLETGVSVVWRHELSQLSDGAYAHIFRSSQVPRPGRAYRIDVVRSDGKGSSATTVIPLLTSLSEPVRSQFREDSGILFQDIALPGVTLAANIEVFYDVTDGGVSHFFRVTRSYDAEGAGNGNGGWQFTLDLSRDAAFVRTVAEPVLGPRLSLNGMGVRVRWADEQWPLVDGPIDIEILAQPGGLSNVENGFGFIGSIGDYLRFWDITDEAMRAALGLDGSDPAPR